MDRQEAWWEKRPAADINKWQTLGVRRRFRPRVAYRERPVYYH